MQTFYTFAATILLASYFLIVYALSKQSFDQIQQNVQIMQSVYQRKSAIDIAVITMLESLTQNRSIMVNKGKDEQINYQLVRMQQKELAYQEMVVQGHDPILAQMRKDIDAIEGTDMCDHYYEGDQLSDIIELAIVNTTRKDCKTLGDGIGTQGMRNFVQHAIMMFNQENITFHFNKGAFRNMTYLLSHLQGELTTLCDLSLKVFTKPSKMFQDRMIIIMSDYNDSIQKMFMLLFFAYVAVIFLLLLVFAISKFLLFSYILGIQKGLRDQVLTTNKMLFIINFEDLPDDQKQRINNFLSNY